MQVPGARAGPEELQPRVQCAVCAAHKPLQPADIHVPLVLVPGPANNQYLIATDLVLPIHTDQSVQLCHKAHQTA